MPHLSSILANAIAQVPRYRGLRSSLECFPVLYKQAVLEDVAAHLSDELGTIKPALAAFLSDENRTCGEGEETVFNRQVIVEETSGSSGIPFRTAKTLAERAGLAYGIWTRRREFDPLCTSKTFYPFIHRPAKIASLGNAGDFRTTNIEQLYDNLTSKGIRWVHGSPIVLRKHGEVIPEALANSKSVRYAESSSVSLLVDDWRFIESHLNVSIIDQYGCIETWAIGTRTTPESFRVLSDNVVVELLDTRGDLINEPDVLGRVVVTSLHLKLFPIIRYDTGDLGAWDKNAVGISLRLSNCRLHNIIRCGDREFDGNLVFKKLIGRAQKAAGYMKLHYLQIRQIAPNKFVLAISQSSKAAILLAELAKACRSHECFSSAASFELHELSDLELRIEAEQKPALFTTKYLL